MFQLLLIIIRLLFVLIFTISVKYIVQYIYIRYRFRNIPSKTGVPFLGIVWELLQIPIEDHHAWFSEITTKLKGNIYVLWIGPRPFINLQKPRHMETLLSSTVNIKKSFVYKLVTPWLGNGLLTSEGEKWFSQRRLLTPAFHFGVLEKFTEVMCDKSKVLNERLHNYTLEYPDKPVDVFEFMSKYTLDIICETAMGVEVDAQRKTTDAYFKAVHEFSILTADRYIRPWYMWDFIFYRTKDGKKFKKSIQIMHEFTTRVITEKLEGRRIKSTDENDTDDFVSLGKKKRKAFLDILLEASENGTYQLSIKEIREQVDTFMFAGHDTTATAITWILFALGNEPLIQQRLREELRDVLNNDVNNLMISSKLMQLKYLDCVIKESLRLYPSAPLIFRDLVEDVIIDGHEIPAGTSITVNICDLHRDPEIWENPLDFNPDRFLASNMIGRHPYSYLPFSAGPRNCIGQKFALLELKVALSSLLLEWQVKSLKTPNAIKFQTDLILRSSQPIELYFTPVTS